MSVIDMPHLGFGFWMGFDLQKIGCWKIHFHKTDEMIELQRVSQNIKNWEVGTNPKILHRIHHQDINIAIYERDINVFNDEINMLLEKNIQLRTSGEIHSIITDIEKEFSPNNFNLITQDIKALLQYFEEVAQVKTFRLLLATVHTNMCRRFHTDINDLRMLCTYSGPGTLWLTDDNINHKALNGKDGNESIVIKEDKIQQVKTGAAVLLKGAIYPQENSNAVVHRSPTIEECAEKRLLLRIDTNESLNLWT